MKLIIFHYSFEMKHSKQLEEARAGSQAAVKELEQVKIVFLSFPFFPTEI